MAMSDNTAKLQTLLAAIQALPEAATKEEIQAIVNEALAEAKASGEFDGEDGVSPTVEVSKSGKITTLTITDAEGSKIAEINDGADGKKGDPGLAWAGDWDENAGYSSGSIVRYNGNLYVAKTSNALIPDGISPDDDPDSWGLLMPAATGVANVYTKTVALGSGEANIIAVELTDGTVKTFSVRNGAKGDPGPAGKTPVAGTDYYTAAEKTKMIADVTAGLAKITLVGTDEDDVQHTWTLHGAAN